MQSYRVIITPRAGFRVIDEDKVVRILTVRHGAQRRPRRFDWSDAPWSQLASFCTAVKNLVMAADVKRGWNWLLWAGFVLVLVGLVSYIPFFAQFPITRDFPWVNLLMFAAGAALLGVGLSRAFGKPDQYRGRIFGSALALLSVLGIGFFCWGVFVEARHLPASAAAPRLGQKAPDFTLPDQDGRPVTLAGLLSTPATGPAGPAAVRPNGVLLIFYRGYW
jgi:hypothetical protein